MNASRPKPCVSSSVPSMSNRTVGCRFFAMCGPFYRISAALRHLCPASRGCPAPAIVIGCPSEPQNPRKPSIMDPKPDNPQDPQGKRRPPMPMRGPARVVPCSWRCDHRLPVGDPARLQADQPALQSRFPGPVAGRPHQQGRSGHEVSGQHYIRGELKDLDAATGKPTTFASRRPSPKNLVEKLTEAKVPFEFKPRTRCCGRSCPEPSRSCWSSP
jgi:hypothetical protein